MNTKEWWHIYRQICRQYGIKRQELILHTKIEPAQWARLERGEGSPTSALIQKVHLALQRLLLQKDIPIPPSLEELPYSVENTLSPEDIRKSFQRHVRRELGRNRIRNTSPEHISFEIQSNAIRNCETIAAGGDQGFHQRGNFERLMRAFLRDGPKNVLWYPSAGEDLRPLFFFSDAFNHIVRAKRESTVDIPQKPDLFIFTSLCHNQRFWPSRILEAAEFNFLSRGQHSKIYEDRRSTIRVMNHTTVYMNRKKHPFVKGYATFGADPREYHRPDGYWLELELTSKKFPEVKERIKLLYLFHENIHFWDSWIVGSGLFVPEKLRLQSLVCSREGLGFGGCERSALIHWLEMPLDIKKEFAPEYIVAFSDFTDSELHSASQRDGFTLRELGPYIPERGGGLMDCVYQVHW